MPLNEPVRSNYLPDSQPTKDLKAYLPSFTMSIILCLTTCIHLLLPLFTMVSRHIVGGQHWI